MARYYGIYREGRTGDRLVDRRVCKAAALKLARRLDRLYPGRLHYVWRDGRHRAAPRRVPYLAHGQADPETAEVRR